MSLIKDSKHLRIPFEDIKEATENFTTLIGRGGYGPVYRGQLSLYGVPTLVAVKQLQTNHSSGQGLKEFLTEIQLLSRCKHQNLVSLVGFCEESNEKFLIYEYAEHGSLDKYLKPKSRCLLTWKQRISICVDAARGLVYLHNHVAQNQRVIHRDIKSANILLDHKWKAMISDFGLSKIGRANVSETYVVTNACGTYGYCDPEYIRTGILTKESDVYSFGVVLFEVLCGSLCFVNLNSEERFLAPLAKRYYEEGTLNLIIDPFLKDYMNSDSMKDFSEVALQCLHDNRNKRPSMALVLHKLEKVLKRLEAKQMIPLQDLINKKNPNGGSGTDVTEEMSLEDTLVAVRNAADAASRIQRAFRLNSMGKKLGKTEDEAKLIIAAMRRKLRGFRRTKKQEAAATRIQCWVRRWHLRKDFLNKRRQAIKIQAYFRGFQVRKQYKKIVWSVGMLEKAILRWRLRTKEFNGLQVAPDENEHEEENAVEETFACKKQEEYRKMKLVA